MKYKILFKAKVRYHSRWAVVKIPKYPKSVLKRSRNPVFGAAGIRILAFHLLDPVPLSAGREFHKIVARFYLYGGFMKKSTTIFVFILALFFYTGSVHAFNGILGDFNSRYPGSSSGANASCQLCHGQSTSTWNEYG
jgi:hypothetical protein